MRLSLVRELDSRVINLASCQRTNHFSKKENFGFQCLMTDYEVGSQEEKNHFKNIERHLARAPSGGGNINTRFI